MIYIDSVAFIKAILDPGPAGVWCRDVLREVKEGERDAATSALTLDEVLYKVRKLRSLPDSIAAGKAMLGFPNLTLVAADAQVMRTAIELIKRHSLFPRDAVHAASAMKEGADRIISEDTDFDLVPGLKSEWIRGGPRRSHAS